MYPALLSPVSSLRSRIVSHLQTINLETTTVLKDQGAFSSMCLLKKRIMTGKCTDGWKRDGESKTAPGLCKSRRDWSNK